MSGGADRQLPEPQEPSRLEGSSAILDNHNNMREAHA